MSDRIEKSIDLKAPQSRVWKALTDHREFGTWFGVRLDGPFMPGQPSTGQLTIKGLEHIRWSAMVQKIEPERYFAYNGIPTPSIPRSTTAASRRPWSSSSWRNPPRARWCALSSPASTSCRPIAATSPSA